MLSEILFRPLNLKDAPDILGILTRVSAPGLPAWSAGQVGEELQAGEGLGAFLSDGTMAAFVLYKIACDHIDISFLACRVDLQNRGVMTQLMRSLMANKSDLPIWLEVHEKNLSARKFYEKLAFKQVGSRARYYHDDGAAVLYSTNI